MAERSIAAVLKTVEAKTSGGSNPSLSANPEFNSNSGFLQSSDSFGQMFEHDQRDDDTSTGRCISDSPMRSTPYVLPKLFDAGGDIRKEWFVFFYYEINGKLKRFRKTEGFAQCQTIEEKRAHGNMLCLKYEMDLRNGWNPVACRRTEKKNHLEYQVQQKIGSNMRIDHWLNRFVEECKLRSLRDKSVSTYLSKFRKFNNWLTEYKLNENALVSFQLTQARVYADYLRRSKISAKTFNAHINTLETAWKWIIRTNQLTMVNPWTMIDKSAVSKSRKQIFNPDQREAILNYLRENDPFLWMVCILIFKSFIRPGREMRGLKIKDIDFHNNVIWIPSEIAKNKKTQGVPLPGEVKSMLLEFKITSFPGEYYLLNPDGFSAYPVSRDFWSKRFAKLMQKMKMPAGLSIYTWKHTGNNIAHTNGMPLKMQKELNRHWSLDQMDDYLSSMTAPDHNEVDKYIKI